MMTNILIKLIERIVPPLVGFALYTICFVVLGAAFMFFAGYNVLQAAIAEVAVVIVVFLIKPDTN